MSDAEKDEPKLIVDEDWKEAVQREKEQAAKQQQTAAAGPEAEAAQSQGSQPETAAPATPQAEAGGEQTAAGAGALPPANFEFLVTTLATQAMMALGQFPGPDGKVGEVDKPVAKHYIDMLAVLEEKTKGNLDAGEQKLVSEVLHNLRMTFVAVK